MESSIRLISFMLLAFAIIGSLLVKSSDFVLQEFGFVIIAIAGLIQALLKCGKCQKSGFYSIFEGWKSYWGFFFGRTCPYCGVRRM